MKIRKCFYQNQNINPEFFIMKKSELTFSVALDDNKLPQEILWTSTENGEKGNAKAVIVSIWEKNEENTLRIDLWTKDMLVDEMKIFFHQTLLSMADTLKRATGEEKMSEDLKDFCAHFADKMNLMKKN